MEDTILICEVCKQPILALQKVKCKVDMAPDPKDDREWWYHVDCLKKVGK